MNKLKLIYFREKDSHLGNVRPVTSQETGMCIILHTRHATPIRGLLSRSLTTLNQIASQPNSRVVIFSDIF
jgi:hypothetical protein